MDRRTFLACAAGAPLVRAAERPPNIVMVLCDDLGYGDLPLYGNKIIRAPNFERFAGEGLRFTDCYAASPVCSPSRVGLLTGRTPDRAGMFNWVPMEPCDMH